MGLAASQARLLTITARLADNELRSQTINNAKMRLATQSSQASENYVNALNQASLMFTNYDSTGAEQSQLLTFNALTGYSQYNNQYGLANAAGMILVNENDAVAFENANGNLNAFLKSKGLEYNTTYFEELCGKNGSYVNDLYPVPFNSIYVEDLQEMYEAYGSYEHSVEMDQYEKLYNSYSSYSKQLESTATKIMNQYITYGLGEPINLGITNYSDFKNKMIDGTSNYSLNNLNTKGYLTKDTIAILSEFYSSITEATAQSTFPYKKGITYTQEGSVPCTYDYEYEKDSNGEPLKNSDGSYKIAKYTYTLDNEVQISGNGNSWTISYLNDAAQEGKTPGYVYSKDENGNDVEEYHYETVTSLGTPAGNTFTSLQDAINAIQVKQPSTDFEYLSKFKYDGLDDEGTPIITETVTETFRDPSKIQEFFNDMFASVTDLICSAGGINVEKFLRDMLNWNNINADTKQELQELMNNYDKSADEFLKFIDAKEGTTDYTSPLRQLITDGKIVPTDLTDLDFLMKLLGGSVYSTEDPDNPLLNNGAITMTSEFKTVVSDFIIKNMISETGEPKYAWIDENDTGNTGNADAKAQWYTNLFNRMKQGYKTLENGLASSPEWMEFALETGIVTVEQVDKTYNWKSIDYKTCSKITEQTDNDAAVAKAEAEYSRAMNDINAKDSIYDIELKNIDTEHTALQTEYESIKTVINKNIERVFKFNQNG